ncbi:bifunctional UDP-N-acetylmuramoyl-tripeptide:D-alanyl-D-alanine ligase/alanine racemase [Pedobacter sp. HMF7647]|uniref:Alanine racemase n=1 Tax=Hufsiella arboris TaxID=2695275 RepID=A0A7K1YD03_9SPHI|nr:bifunctional UDP-N-acetylmuramoyl-tripeptide:D-alanyl-D-alanine ligase/alanine racemase [Hufsiella arboris]MXV52300.1 bifunctional UDP-N-acetylmuramoyl-tripeptide:D-alanyl-D-alanine ligase/alanine racemase [Hufsiella arboris]
MSHKLYTIQEIQAIIHADGVINHPETSIRTLSIDSRKLTDMEHALFFALKGRRNSHDFITDIYESGIRSFVIYDKEFNVSAFPDANFLIVDDTLKALQLLAAYHRSLFTYPVIAITGSNGKTIVKEWLYQLLSPEFTVIRSPKSYNSQIGVPLSVWQMTDEHTLAIIETGISKAGEMEALEKIVKPTIGILTNIGEAHNEGFSSTEEKIEEKLKLFENCGLFIYSPFYLRGYTGTIPGRTQFTWCHHAKADLDVWGDEILENKYQFLRGEFKGGEVQCIIPFTDHASVENAICCWATMLAMDYNPEISDKRLEKLLPVRMRLEMKTGNNNCSVIDDSYSLDISSLTIALDFLRQQNQHVKRTLILSDIPESGVDPANLYEQVARLLENKDLDKLIGVGPMISSNSDLFKIESRFFDSTEDLLQHLNELPFFNETILLKGARAFGFEKISRALTQKVHETVLEINLNALENNLNFYKSLLNPGVKVMAMVKAFSYGSGSFEIANLLQFNKIDYLAVAFADEGVTLRKAGINLPIMVMNADELAFETIIQHKLEPEIYNFRVLENFIDILNQKNIEQYPVHIKIDTGMHRLGFMDNEVDALLDLIHNTDAIEVKSAFSHLVGSEDVSLDDFTDQQISSFATITDKIEKSLGYKFIRHIANTSGISRWKQAQFDMVRLGIGLYGIDNAYQERSPLESVAVLKTSVSQLKNLKAGESVGYNRKGVLSDDGTIATVKIGYADGYDRRLGNGVGQMSINGKIVPVIGNVCMDMCMLNVSGIDVKEGDEVIVFGKDIKIEKVAADIGTIAYELLTGISQRVKRVYFSE